MSGAFSLSCNKLNGRRAVHHSSPLPSINKKPKQGLMLRIPQRPGRGSFPEDAPLRFRAARVVAQTNFRKWTETGNLGVFGLLAG